MRTPPVIYWLLGIALGFLVVSCLLCLGFGNPPGGFWPSFGTTVYGS